ncbi:MAG: oxygenase, partial [Sphingomonadales bacterium]
MSKSNGKLSGSPSPNRARIAREVDARLMADPNIRRAKIETAQMYTYPNFLGDAECDVLMGLIDGAARPSTLLATHEDPEFRTSDSTDLDRWSETIWPIDDRIAQLLGLPPENAETMQG